jgi:O-antigen ligase
MSRLIFSAYAALIALAPLPFGSNRLWSWSLAAGIAALLLCAWALRELRVPTRETIPASRYMPALVCFAATLAWAFAQAFAGVPGVAANPLWQQAAAALGALSPHTAISLNPGESLTGAMRLLTYAVTFWLALQLCRETERAGQLLWIVVLSGSVYAVYGLVVEFADLQSILWYPKWAYADALTATFVNRNTYATYAGMVSITTLGLLASDIDHARTQTGAAASGFIQTIDSLPPRAYVLIGCLIIIGTALFLTESRAGIASTAAGMAVFLVSYMVYRRRRGRGTLWFTGTVIIVLIMLAAISGRGVVDRMAFVEENLAGRTTVWAMTREASSERPLAGSGLATFDDVYLAKRDERLPPETLPFEQAHNSYLENALELGLPATASLLFAVVWLGGWCVWGVAWRRRNGIYPCVALGALSVGAVHAVFDFSLQIPAVTLTLMALLGAGCAQSDRRGQQATSGTSDTATGLARPG